MNLTEEQIAALPIKDEEVKKKFVAWITNSPESFHRYDMIRWLELVLAVLKSDYGLDLYEIHKVVPLDLALEQYSDEQTILDYYDSLYQVMIGN